MSKLPVPLLIAIWATLSVLLLAAGICAQSLDASVSVDEARRSAFVEGRFLDGKERRNLSFLRSAIGVADLGKRISDVVVKRSGHAAAVKKLQSAEYIASAPYSEFSYRVDLRPDPDPRSAAHSSWIADELAVIFPDELLPLSGSGNPSTLTLRIKAPDGWVISSDSNSTQPGTFEIRDIGRAVFVLGKGLLRTSASSNADILQARGSQFSADETSAMTAEIFDHYTELFGGMPVERSLIAVVPFPQEAVQKGVWEAETRGRTVFIVSSDMPFRSQSLQRLHEQLRHEIFHLWLPNAVSLTGNYDWFYEGFALYEALKTGVALNRLRFEDMLDTLSRAHSIDAARTRPLSLIAASNARWQGAETSVYARGMITAFICDIELLSRPKGRTSIDRIFRRVFERHKTPATPADGNAALLQVFEGEAGLSRIAREYIVGDKPIDLKTWLAASGLENAPGTSRTGLRIRAKLTASQKTVLDELGYNNWRKLNRK